VAALKREYSSEILREIALYLDQLNLVNEAKEFDNLRSRLDTLKKPDLLREPRLE